jgi:hypothetical protein
VNETGHTPGEWVTVTPATKTANGSNETSCTVCGEKLIEVIPAIGSEGLAFTLKSDGTYSVSGIGTCTDTNVVIPAVYNEKPVKSIDYRALSYCNSLTSIAIPESVTSIGDQAFYSCSSLESVTIPESVTSIGFQVFSGCSRLTEIYVHEKNMYYCSDNGILFNKEKTKLLRFIEERRIIDEIKQSVVWARLFGGAGLVIMVDQDPKKEFDINKVHEGSPLEFKAADMWELYKDQTNIWNPWETDKPELLYNYYGVRLNRTRVLPICGKVAPSFIKPRLRGWGMSELERVVRSINSYLKNQDLIFELLDEAKIDVYQLNGFNTAMLTANGTKVAERRVQVSNSLKSYLNALILDTNDKYEQKQ